MRKLTLILVSLVLAAGLIYWFPPIHQRLYWRVDFAQAYLRGLVDPVKPPPTSLPKPEVSVIIAPTTTATPANSPTPSPTVEFTPTPQPTSTPVPQSVALPAPLWEKQDMNNCGPASLTMYLRFYGWKGNQQDIDALIKPLPEDRNVNVDELVYFVRTRAGWLNAEFRVGGNLEMLKQFLAAGIPVMIEESFYFEKPYWINDDLWAAHYFLVTGYDEAARKFVGQDSFRGANTQVTYETLDSYWQAFNRVYILVYLPGQEPAVKTILGTNWDKDANRQHALETAQSETQRDPKNAFTWFNLGANLTYFERYDEATNAFDKARNLKLPQRMFRYQFAPFIAYFHTNQIDDLVALTEYALKITPSSEEGHLWHGWAMYRLGKKTEAIADFQKALEENSTYQDAKYALDYMAQNP